MRVGNVIDELTALVQARQIRMDDHIVVDSAEGPMKVFAITPMSGFVPYHAGSFKFEPERPTSLKIIFMVP